MKKLFVLMSILSASFWPILSLSRPPVNNNNFISATMFAPNGALNTFTLSGSSLEASENLGYAPTGQTNQSAWFKFTATTAVMYLQVIKPTNSPNISVNLWNNLSSLPLAGGLQAFTGQSAQGPNLDTITFFNYFFVPGQNYYIQVLGYNSTSQLKIRAGSGGPPNNPTYISNGPSSGSAGGPRSICNTLDHLPTNGEILSCSNGIDIQPQRRPNSVFDFYVSFTPSYSTDTTFFRITGRDSILGLINTNMYTYYRWWAYTQGSIIPFATGNWNNSAITNLSCGTPIILRFTVEHGTLANPYKYYGVVWGKTPFQCGGLRMMQSEQNSEAQIITDSFVINSQSAENLTIFNMMGSTVKTLQVSPGSNTIQLSDLTPGLYIWTTESGQTGRIFKQ